MKTITPIIILMTGAAVATWLEELYQFPHNATMTMTAVGFFTGSATMAAQAIIWIANKRLRK